MIIIYLCHCTSYYHDKTRCLSIKIKIIIYDISHTHFMNTLINKLFARLYVSIYYYINGIDYKENYCIKCINTLHNIFNIIFPCLIIN